VQFFSKITDLTVSNSNIVIALGAFDGIHIGHQSILRQTIALAKSIQGKSMVFTFSNHPLSVLAPDRAPLKIGDNFSRKHILAELGIDILVDIPFTKKFAKISPEDFLQMLKENFAPKFIVSGPNYTFGYRGKGTTKMLLREGAQYGFQAEIHPAVYLDGRMVSSTQIRKLIAGGDLLLANEYLGRPFTFSGPVIHGDKRGRTLGFPTANLAIGNERAMLPNGVYAAQVILKESDYNALVNVGNNPTFAGCNRRLEAHLLDFQEDIYDAMLQVRFLRKLRDEQEFSSAEALVKQMHLDLNNARSAF